MSVVCIKFVFNGHTNLPRSSIFYENVTVFTFCHFDLQYAANTKQQKMYFKKSRLTNAQSFLPKANASFDWSIVSTTLRRRHEFFQGGETSDKQIGEMKNFEIHDQLYHELAFTHWWNLVGSLSTLVHYIIGCQQTTFWSVKELSAWNYFHSSSLIATFRQKILSWCFTEFICILTSL